MKLKNKINWENDKKKKAIKRTWIKSSIKNKWNKIIKDKIKK
jgi:hypothetical protein